MRMRHPISRVPYERLEDGTVLVGEVASGQGIFGRDGQWISGDRKKADAMLCMHVSVGFVQFFNREHAVKPQQDKDSRS